MKKKIWIHSCTVLFILVVVFSSCDGVFSTPIGNLRRSPRDYDGKRLTISGIVMEKNSFLFTKYFVLQDKTGEIHVVTDRVLPNVGDSTTVHGRLEEAFSLGDVSALVFIEDSGETEH